MKLKIPFSLFLILVTVVSCLDESWIELESPYKTDIVNYLNSLKVDKEDDNFNTKIESLAKAIEYAKITERDIRGGEILLIADFENLQDFNEEGTSKVLFFVNQGVIVRSHIIAFSQKNDNYDDLIVTLFNYQFNPDTYTGRISLYSVTQDIQMYKVFENGEIRESGITQADWDRDAGGKTNSCIDWYLITTYYFAGGGKQTTEEYLFTTCDCESQNTRVGKVNCAGGNGTVDGGSGGYGSPILPSNPQPGEIYEFRDREG